MTLLEIFLVAVGLAMDAFGVAIGKGLMLTEGESYKKFVLSFLFALFQFIMPLIGWFVGSQFIDIISEFNHWIIFILLSYLGISMIRQSRGECTCAAHAEQSQGPVNERTLGMWEMIMLAVATSLDALAVGLTFAFLSVNVWEASSIIGLVAFAMSMIGVYLGKFMGRFVGEYAEIIGGVVLILIGLKILLQHLGIIVGLI